MTTKLQHLINPLTRAPQNFFRPANSLCYLEIVDPLMERSFDSRNLESMRKTMQMQEEIFKQQVEELHRLYNVQKKLMQEVVLQNGLKRKNETLMEAETDQTGLHFNFQVFKNARDDDNGSCSGESSKLNPPIKFDLERPTESAPSNIQRIDDQNDVEVELTLSIGNNKHKRSKSQPNKGEEDQESGESSSVIISRSNSSTVYKENTRPHWLMQDLSLNRT